MDDTDEEDLDSDDEADGMVLDERENEDDLSDDQASLNLRDSDEETDVDSVMMVSFDVQKYLYYLCICFLVLRMTILL